MAASAPRASPPARPEARCRPRPAGPGPGFPHRAARMRPHILHPRKPPQQRQLERTGEHPRKPAHPRNVRPEEPDGDVTVHAHLVHVGLEPGRREPAPRRPRRHPRLAAGRELERAPEQELAPRQRPGAPRGLRFRQRNRVERAPQVLLLVRSLRTARERQRW